MQSLRGQGSLSDPDFPRRCPASSNPSSRYRHGMFADTAGLGTGIAPGEDRYRSCLLPQLSRLSVRTGPEIRLRHRCSSRYLRISPLHREFRSPLPASSPTVSNAGPGLSPGFSHPTYRAACARFTPNESGQRSPPTSYRGCWHVVGRGFFCGYRHFRFVPAESGLQPEGLHPARGVAASGLPPLRKIPHCCLP